MSDNAAADRPPSGEPEIRVVAMPADTNPYGDIFGGWLMSQMDLAAGAFAVSHSAGRAVTAAVEGMSFHRPVKVGDLVSFYATLSGTGRTSIRVHVQAWRRSRSGGAPEKVTEATFIFVAIDDEGRPRPLAPLAESTYV